MPKYVKHIAQDVTLSGNILDVNGNPLISKEGVIKLHPGNKIVDNNENLLADDTGLYASGIGGEGHVHVHNEEPSGLKNGSNCVYKTVHTFTFGSTRLFLNGLRQQKGNDYQETNASTITLAYIAPENEDIIIIDYIRD